MGHGFQILVTFTQAHARALAHKASCRNRRLSPLSVCGRRGFCQSPLVVNVAEMPTTSYKQIIIYFSRLYE